jgi:predicted nucleic acid-binding protein
MRVFLDTNVLLDVFDTERSGHRASMALFIAGEQQQVELIITGLSLVNVEYVLRRMRIPTPERRAFIGDSLKLCVLAPTDEPQVKAALKLAWPDFEDALQYSAAASMGRVQAIITSDVAGFRASRIPVFTPEQFANEHLNA